MHSRHRALLALGTALAAGALAACGDNAATTSGTPSAQPSATVPAGPVDHPPQRTGGSAAALSRDQTQLFVADEDHEVVFVAPASFADLSPLRVVPMPGPPAQIVVADDLVLVTVRTLPADDAKAARDELRGPLPEASKARRLAPGTLKETSYWVNRLAPADYKRYLQDGGVAADVAGKPSASAKASAPGAPSGKPSASAKAKPAAKPVSSRAESGFKSFDTSVVRRSRGGLLLAMKPDAERGLVEVGRLVLPPDAWGLAVTPDGRRAVVTSAWTAQISVVDVNAMKVVATLPSAREPRGVVIAKDGKTAYVTHLSGGDLTRIDGVDGEPKAAPQPLAVAPVRTSEGWQAPASNGYSLVLSPGDDSLYVPRHAIAADGHNSWWGAPTVDVLDRRTGQAAAPFNRPKSPAAMVNAEGLRGDRIWLPEAGSSPKVVDFLVQPRAVVYRKKNDTILVAGEGYDTLAELDALAPDPSLFVRRMTGLAIYDYFGEQAVRGGAPSAIALSSDEDTAYVYCRTTYDVIKLDLTSYKAEWLRLADDALPDQAAKGRRLFVNARSWELSGGLGCASCHPEGRDDGHVWRGYSGEVSEFYLGSRYMGFASEIHTYPRQTPMLAGRVRAAGPYGWHGESPNLIARIEKGTDLHRPPWAYGEKFSDYGPFLGKIDALAHFVRLGLLPPPVLEHPLTDPEKRGKEVFESSETQCSKCHVPANEFTDRIAYPLRALPVVPSFEAEPNSAFRTPSLLFVGATAPYFHDGSQATLDDLVKNNGSRMGQTSHLSAEDQSALVAYLKTL